MNIWHDISADRIKPEDFMAVIEIPKGIHGVREGDGDDLLVVLPAVGHGDVPHGETAHQRQRGQGLGAEHQHVQRVAVVAVGPGDKAIVGGVMGGGVQNAVQDDQARLLVQLVLVRVYKALEGKEAVAGDVNGREAAVNIIAKAQENYDAKFGQKK